MPRLSKIGAAALGAFGWTGLNNVTASYLQVAGGGGGGSGDLGSVGGAGGGAGGYLTGTTSLDLAQSYTVVVGAGGAGGIYTSGVGQNGVQGSNSQFGVLTASVGGGYGAYSTSGAVGGNGGSGGGGAYGSAGGTATSGQGSAGGTGSSSLDCRGSGGGGGASAVGSNGSSAGGGNGGNGTASSITGTSVTYAGGGGGGALYRGGGFTVPTVATGGTGGGGNSGTGTGGNGNPGTANLGGGGGGPVSIGAGTFDRGGNGGSGVVIISYPSPQKFGGGVVTASGGNTIHTFTTSGTLSPLSSLTANFLVIAGGGSGADYGGGGAGGLRSTVTNTGGGGSLESTLTIDTNSIYLVTVGAGGTGGIIGANGSNSVFFSITSTGGGRGANNTTPTVNGSSGGSGGGGRWTGGTGGAGTANQGFAGGAGGSQTTSYPAGGGGGAGAVGGNGTTGGSGGNGGAGVASSISGSSVTYAGGGGGGCAPDPNGVGGSGGSGGGGTGGTGGSGTTAGTANTGGGGGGAGSTGSSGGSGGSGIVIISYPGSTQQMAGGTVTVAGGNVIHTFTSSGYLAPIFTANNSVRFRSSINAFLSRTPTVTSNRRTWTWSGWVKLGEIGRWEGIFNAGANANQFAMYLYTDYTLYIQDYTGSNNIYLQTTQVFRDPSAWYHIVFAVDTTQATSTDRFKLYINGTQVTSFVSTTYPSQNYDTQVNSTSYQNNIGLNYQFGTSNGKYFDGYMSEINFIDGQALTPNSFGYYSDLGVWQPIRYGGSYGSNGFYLPFNAGTLTFAGNFNGSSQYLTIAQNAAFNMGSGDFTLESWVYFGGSGRAAILSQTDSGGTTTSTSFYLERTASNFLRFLVASSSTSYEITGTTAISSGRWVHVAGVRNGNNLLIYLNGVLQGTTSVTGVSLNSSTQNVQINGYGTSTATVFSGAMSNVRIVKGTAVYTSNFVPPTANLTAISGTSLLTLQNATIVDNSTNAFSITNTGTVTIVQTYPFSAARIFNDQSPQGNNWASQNIFGLSGATGLDYMTDVPTNTSATVANYAVLNPLRPFGGSLSNGNLNAVTGNTGSANSGVVTSTVWLPTSGKFYFEATPTTVGEIAIGLTTNSNISAALYYRGGDIYINGSVATTQASYTNNDVIGVAVDIGNATVQFYKNNAAQGTAQSISAITAPLVACLAQLSGGGSATANINFGQQPFAYTPPTNFVALNTFNLTTPTIGATAATKANKYMDVTTYTGNSTAGRVITMSNMTNVGFAWVKIRSGSDDHRLANTVTGGNKHLQSNTTAAEGTGTNIIQAFSSNTFTVGSDNSVNVSGSTYVGWVWANDGTSGSTNTAGSITSTVSANTTAGFSVVTWTGNGSNSDQTLGTGLSTALDFIIAKPRDTGGGTDQWLVYTSAITLNQNQCLLLNSTNQTTTTANSGTPNRAATAGQIKLWAGSTNNQNLNANTLKYVAYCFHAVAGYSAFGSYTGNGVTDGPFVYLGFRPRFVMIKRTDSSGNWNITDTAINPYNNTTGALRPNTAESESTVGTVYVQPLSNGFKITNNNTDTNGSGTYIYMAFAESPFKYANAR